MRIMVTGANGMLGKDLHPILKNQGYEIFETDIDNMDITNNKEVEKVVSNCNPHVIIHCAAYTNVEKAEIDFETADLINHIGTKNVAINAQKNNASMIYVSTDYVFDGESNIPYKPEFEPKPINNYGITKFYGEVAVKQNCEKHYIVRTSWLYGLYGNNFVETMISLSNKSEIKVVDDQIGCPTWTVDLCNFISLLVPNVFKYGIYHYCGSGSTSWFGFAKKVFELMNTNVNLIPCKSEDFVQKARRPKYSVMDVCGFSRKWEDMLKNYIELRSKMK